MDEDHQRPAGGARFDKAGVMPRRAHFPGSEAGHVRYVRIRGGGRTAKRCSASEDRRNGRSGYNFPTIHDVILCAPWPLHKPPYDL